MTAGTGQGRLIWKLLLIHLAVIGSVLVIVWLAIDTLAAGYFVTLMERYHISPAPAHAMFVDAVHRYLLWACGGAMLLAAILSYLMMRRVLDPLGRMTAIARRMAAGDFSGRAPADARDEVGELAAAFNRMADSLETLERLRRNLMIDVAHELRTPLTNMRGYLEALRDGVIAPDPDTLSLLHDETLRLADLVEDVLRLARADAARGHLDLRPLDLEGIIAQACAAFSTRLAARDMTVRRRGPEAPPGLMADPLRLGRVMRNLLDNAVRYAPAGDGLDIGTAAANGRVRLELTNTAPDLAPADLPFLFERFFRAEKSRSRQHGGAGIGLSIVKELVAAHGGQVGAELDGDRLTVWFDLPCRPNPEKDAAQ